MDLIVFNVDHGLCVLVRTPSGHAVMIDIGCSDEFKPADWVANPLNIDLVEHQGRRLAWLVVTHPHDDHVEGIDSLISNLQPSILTRQKNLNWTAILNPKDGDPSENAKTYQLWQRSYSQPVVHRPDLQCSFQHFALKPSEADALGGTLQNKLNNSSHVCVFTWEARPGYVWKVVVCGDNEEKGLQALLKKPGFREAVSGADVLVTPHHGHKSGFCREFMDAVGKPLVCIASLPRKDQHLDERYRDEAVGVTFNDETRYVLSTKNDGHVWFRMSADGYSFREVTGDLGEALKRILLR